MKDLIWNSWFDLDTSIIMLFIEKSKVKHWIPCKIAKDISFLSQDESFECLDYLKEDVV